MSLVAVIRSGDPTCITCKKVIPKGTRAIYAGYQRNISYQHAWRHIECVETVPDDAILSLRGPVFPSKKAWVCEICKTDFSETPEKVRLCCCVAGTCKEHEVTYDGEFHVACTDCLFVRSDRPRNLYEFVEDPDLKASFFRLFDTYCGFCSEIEAGPSRYNPSRESFSCRQYYRRLVGATRKAKVQNGKKYPYGGWKLEECRRDSFRWASENYPKMWQEYLKTVERYLRWYEQWQPLHPDKLPNLSLEEISKFLNLE